MGILDRLSRLTGGNKKKERMAGLVKILVDQFGGVDGLVKRLEERGLATQVATWIGDGSNAPVSAESVTNALGSETVAAVANQIGVGFDQAAQRLALVLPRIIDRVTPEGKVPADGYDIEGLNDVIGGAFDR